MAAYDTLRAAIDNYIKANGNKEITGTVLNDILNAMVSALGADTRFAGVAVPTTNPGNPEGNVVYFASQAGTYSNFGGIVLPLGIHILVWNGTAWTSQTWFSVDNTPTQNSQNLATSGGILQAIVDAVGVERLRAIGVEVTSCSFDGTTKKISFFNSADDTLFQLDATAFVIDGMVSDVKIEDGNLVIQFNTDAGKQDIEIPLTDIFNPANYYTKTATDDLLALYYTKTATDDLLALYYTKTETDALLTAINNKLADGCLYRGMAEPTTNPPTPTTKVFYIATKAGTYTNFGNIAVTEGITILKHDGSNWSKEQICYSDGVFDISAYNGTSYADLSAALGTNGANIPQNLRKGGMSVKFVQSSDNKYVQYRLMHTLDNASTAAADFTNIANWQGVDDEPIYGSNNLVKSGGVNKIVGTELSDSYECVAGIQIDKTKIRIEAKLNAGQEIWIKVDTDEGVTKEGRGYIRSFVGYNETTLITYPVIGTWYKVILDNSIDGISVYYPDTTVLNNGNMTLSAMWGHDAEIKNLQNEVETLNTNIDTINVSVASNTEKIGKVQYGTIQLEQGVAVGESDGIIVDIPAGISTYKVYLACDETFVENGYLNARNKANDVINLIIYPNYVNSATQGSRMNKVLEFERTDGVSKIWPVFTANQVKKSGTFTIILGYGAIFDEFIDNYKQSKDVAQNSKKIGVIQSGTIQLVAGTAISKTDGIIVDIPVDTDYKVYIECDKSAVEYGYLSATNKNNFDISLITYPNYLNSSLQDSRLNVILDFSKIDGVEKIWPVFSANQVKKDGNITIYIGYGVIFDEFINNHIQKQQIHQLSADIENINDDISSTFNGVINPSYKNGVFWSHMYAGVSESTMPVIPSQSIFDIQNSARLGFKYIEANVHQTSDGKYVCIHGYQGNFWWYVEGVNGEDIHDIAINSKTLAWIKENVRYRTSIPRYKTSIPTLAEFCEECRRNNILPSVQCINEEVFRIAKGYFGDSFAVYAGSRQWGWKGLVMGNFQGSDAEQAITNLKAVGAPCFCNINPSEVTAMVNNNTLKSYINTIHNAGFLVSCAGNYLNQRDVFAMVDAGADMILSGSNTNDFEYGNLVDVTSDLGFSSFAFTGASVVNGELVFTEDGTLSITDSTSVFLGKGSLHIIFNGEISFPENGFGNAAWINGSVQYRTFNSEGNNRSMWMSTYFRQSTTGFTLNVKSGTVVSFVSWKASKV